MSLSSSQPKIMLITGTTGFIGSRLATLAIKEGYIVRTLTRNDWDTSPAVPVKQRYFGNFPAQIPREAFDGTDIVVHCAAQLEGNEQSANAVNVEGTSRLGQMARQAGVQTIIFLSSQSARPDALSAYGRTKYAAEQALLELEGINVTILRPGLVTGAGGRGLYHRMCKMVEGLPIVPLLAGGKSIVQPIHVDDLCLAIFRCCEMATELNGAVLNLGDSEGISLAQFLQMVALHRYSKQKIMVPIPLWPVEIMVKVAEALRIPLPINTNNLQGLKVVEKMETGTDTKRLGLTPRSLEQTVRGEFEQSAVISSLAERAVRMLLIGAGRIGLVHAVTLSRLTGIKLVGLVDPNPKAIGLLKGMGVNAPAYSSLDQALAQTQADAVVIATPVASHLPLTKTCLQQKVAVMVEKPLALRSEQLDEYEQLLRDYPDSLVQVGYVMLRNPQVACLLDRLKQGEFGQVQSFTGITLSSLIQETTTKRWEVKKEISGGGVFINAGGHVLSMIRGAFGDPISMEAQSINLFSSEVEDSLVVKLDYSGFHGTHYCSWSISGYPRQENRLIIWTERGCLILTGSMGVFIPVEGEMDIIHQLDFPLSFNIAPDYAGGGFTTELTDLQQATITSTPAPVNVDVAIKLERLLFKVYDKMEPVTGFTDALTVEDSSLKNLTSLPRLDEHLEITRILDLRELSTGRTSNYLSSKTKEVLWDEYLLTPLQVKELSKCWPTDKKLRVTVPDFLNQSRLLSTGRYIEVVQQMGPLGVIGAAFGATPLVLSERGATFWVAAFGLLAAGLKSIPASFDGTIFLHPYLTDFALSLRRLDILDKMLKTCRQTLPKAKVGFHTNMSGEAVQALWLLDTLVDEVSALTAPNARYLKSSFEEMRRACRQKDFKITAEVGLAPAIVHCEAARVPMRWTFGAEAIMLGPAADPDLAVQHQTEVNQEWQKAFPGLQHLPEGVF